MISATRKKQRQMKEKKEMWWFLFIAAIASGVLGVISSILFRLFIEYVVIGVR